MSYTPLNSPIFTGTPRVPNVAYPDSSTKIANTAFVSGNFVNIVDTQSVSGAKTFSALLEASNSLTVSGNSKSIDITGSNSSLNLSGSDNWIAITGVAGNSSQPFYMRQTGDGNQRFILSGNGKLEWGDGSASVDASLERTGANILQIGANDFLRLPTAPSGPTDAVNRAYVDSAINGLDWHGSVRYTTTGDITLSGLTTQANGDWPSTLTVGNRILVKDQTTGADNGVYTAASGAWSRALDADVDAEVTSGFAVFVTEGATLSDRGYVLVTDDPITLGTTALSFSQFSSLTPVTTLDSLTDVDTTGVVDGSLLRYEATGSQWNDTTSSTLLLSDAGQLLIPTTGSGAGVLIGGDTQLYRSAADILRTPDSLTIDTDLLVSGATSLQGGFKVKTATKTANYSLVAISDNTILADSTSGSFTVTLPATHTAGTQFTIKDSGGVSSTNPIALATADSDTIDGSASDLSIASDYESITVQSDGTNWFIV